MAKIKLTKTVVDAAATKDRDYELRDTIVPGFLLKVTPAGGKIFMLQYMTNSGIRRKPDHAEQASDRLGAAIPHRRSIPSSGFVFRPGGEPGVRPTRPLG